MPPQTGSGPTGEPSTLPAEYCVGVTALDRLPKIGAPAARALEAAGYTSLSDLAGVSRAHLAELHGVGPRAIDIIQAALEGHDLTLS